MWFYVAKRGAMSLSGFMWLNGFMWRKVVLCGSSGMY